MPILIYSQPNSTGPSSVSDLKKLFELACPESRDIREFGLDASLEGLDKTYTLVVPGGSTTAIQRDFSKKSTIGETIVNLVNNYGVNYIGICAGAYVASNSAHAVFTPSQKLLDGLNLINVAAIGGISPGTSIECNITPAPEVVTTYKYDSEISYGMFISGCTFFQENIVPDYTVLEYIDTKQGATPSKSKPGFFERDNFSSAKKIPVTVYQQGKIDLKTRCKSGNVLLTGIHPEAAVPESKLLEFATSSESYHAKKINRTLTSEEKTNFNSAQKEVLAKAKQAIRAVITPHLV